MKWENKLKTQVFIFYTTLMDITQNQLRERERHPGSAVIRNIFRNHIRFLYSNQVLLQKN